eukprot:6492417-Amphidinium_carterae.2
MATQEQIQLVLEQNQELHARLEAVTQQLATVQAAQASQPVAPAPRSSITPPIDTRVLGKPDHFDGSTNAWKDWSTVLRAYSGAVNPELQRHMLRAETTEDAVDNLALSVDASSASQTLYYILIMLCKGSALTRVVNSGTAEGLQAWRALCRFYEPKTATRHASLLLEVLNFDFQGEPQERIAAFDRVVSRYELAAGEVVGSKVKVGLILKQLPEGGLKQHLVLNLERWDTYEKLRSEVENIARAQAAAQHSTVPMDLNAINPTKGGSGVKGGKAKGGKGGPNAQDACRICGKTGHWAKDCWQKDKGAGKGKGKKGTGKDGSKGGKQERDKSKTKCWKCGKTGHMAKECRSGGAHSLTESGGDQAPPPVSGLFLAALHSKGSIHSVSRGRVVLGIDSGAAASAIMDEVAADFPIVADGSAGSYYESAAGEQIEDRGQVTIACKVEQEKSESQLRVLRMRRAAVTKNLLAVDDLLATGHRVVFDRGPDGRDASYMEHKMSGLKTRFHYSRRVWELHVEVLSQQRTKEVVDGHQGSVPSWPALL